MREIKFRAWVPEEYSFCKKPSKMHTGFSFKNIHSGYSEANTECLDGTIIEEPDWDNIIVMQFTGLKDKNGKEIYEGDIINQSPQGADIPMVVQWKEGQYFNKECEVHGWIMPYAHFFRGGKVEILGNIYENPELIRSIF